MNESYARVGASIWREFRDDSDRLLALYLLTCEHRTMEGLFYLPLGYAAADLGWKDAKVVRHLERVERQGMVRYDHEASVCWIVKALKWQAPANPNQVKAAVKKLVALPDTPLLLDFYLSAERLCEPFAERLRERFGERLRERFPERFGEGFGEPPTPAPTPTPEPPLTPPRGGSRRRRSARGISHDPSRVLTDIERASYARLGVELPVGATVADAESAGAA